MQFTKFRSIKLLNKIKMDLRINQALSRETLYGQSVPDKRFYKETFTKGKINVKNKSSINLTL